MLTMLEAIAAAIDAVRSGARPKISQAELARRVSALAKLTDRQGLTEVTLQRYINSKPGAELRPMGIDHFWDIAAALGVKASALMADAEDRWVKSRHAELQDMSGISGAVTPSVETEAKFDAVLNELGVTNDDEQQDGSTGNRPSG